MSVHVAFAEFDVTSAPVSVSVSFAEFDTAGGAVSVCVSFAEFDATYQQIAPSPIYGGSISRYYNERYDRYEVPVPAHNEAEEEEIIMMILMEIAHAQLQ